MGRGIWVVVALGLAMRSAMADAPAEPWKDGVSPQVQARANALFKEANAQFAKQMHRQALALYEQARDLWDNPLFDFNIAVALVRLDRYLEAADALEHALRFGAAPFTADSYGQVLVYRDLVLAKVGQVEVTCAQQGVQVTLDGQRWFTCPGTHTRAVEPGGHSLSADGAGYAAQVHTFAVAKAETFKHSIEMVTVRGTGSKGMSNATQSATSTGASSRTSQGTYELTRRMPTWVPYAVLLGGVASVTTGALLRAQGGDLRDQFRRESYSLCPGGSCAPEDYDRLIALNDRANSRMTLGTVGLIVGGVAVTTGIALAIINRPRRALRAVDVSASARGAAVSARWSF